MSGLSKWLSGGMLLSTTLVTGGCEVGDFPDGQEGQEGTAIEEVATAGAMETERIYQALKGHGREVARNHAGLAETIHTSGVIDRTNPFFQPIGVNPRSCESCHASTQGWTITAEAMTRLFWQSQGLAPVFMTHDSGSRPDANISTLQSRLDTWKRNLLAHGVTRFQRTIPATAEFTATAVVDPYGFSTPAAISSFRRPTPTVNEAKTSSVTWTGGPHDVPTQLAATAGGASRFHLQRVDLPPPEITGAMRDFQMGLFFAQTVDNAAGPLDAAGANGGPHHLKDQPFYLGINDLQGNDPQAPGRPFSRKVFTLFDAWARYDRGGGYGTSGASDMYGGRGAGPARAAIYRGQELFNSWEFSASGVTGLNDLLGQPVVKATCSTCHNAPNVGGHSVFRMFDIGTADEPSCSSDVPIITLSNKTTLATRKVCDMGRATSTGKWADIGAFRAPPLRGLAARAPYFHDGQARDLAAVVRYYDKRFKMGLTSGQKRDLEAFLQAL
jgi:cytochrome c peroxidase